MFLLLVIDAIMGLGTKLESSLNPKEASTAALAMASMGDPDPFPSTELTLVGSLDFRKLSLSCLGFKESLPFLFEKTLKVALRRQKSS